MKHTIFFLAVLICNCTFALHNSSYNEQINYRFTEKNILGRRLVESTTASLLLCNGLLCGDLPIFIYHSKLSKMHNRKATKEWAVPQLQLVYNAPTHSKPLTTTKQAAYLLLKIWDKQLLPIQEQFYILLLNSNNQLIGWRLLHTGTTNACTLDYKLLAAICTTSLAQKVIVAHNHPSGNTFPSFQDEVLTDEIKSLLKIFNIILQDHIIITTKGFYSFSTNNLLL